MVHSSGCYLYEPDGTPLSRGVAQIRSDTETTEAVVTALDNPGRVVQRLMLGSLHDLKVMLDDDAMHAARVKNVFFDPKAGRTCTLRILPN